MDYNLAKHLEGYIIENVEVWRQDGVETILFKFKGGDSLKIQTELSGAKFEFNTTRHFKDCECELCNLSLGHLGAFFKKVKNLFC